ncbi:glycosyltransferase [Cellulomonas sp. ATA003]|uniref:glycosyltransferase n=1 Tax=Cellulomonas sp. ATA003 TaxID=3073064 RepID=UPI0028735E52|nr:glycosyltransferase [Cellulomonas sp. ATA003]WNB85084.1 glycosyltransferase [Cellulomonas sp. ATA003]
MPGALSESDRFPGVSTVFVVVPAHDEERVVQRGVRALLADPSSDAHVLVVANGCTDATAERVRELRDPRVSVLELAEGGKARAVRAGLSRSGTAQVVAVVDADVVLDDRVLPGLVHALAGDEPRIAAPSLALELDGCSPLVRRYYRAWGREPHVRTDDIGARGIYAVNRAGLERVASMPDVIADDGWARARFAPHERVVSAGTSTVRPAQTLRAQVARRARVLAGNRELREVLPLSERPAPRVSTGVGPQRTFGERLREDGAGDTAAWYAVEVPARLLTAWRRKRGRSTPWARDTTTRR